MTTFATTFAGTTGTGAASFTSLPRRAEAF